MSPLQNLLAEAFGKPAAIPSESALSATVTATAYWTFSAHLEVVLAEAKQLPAEGQAIAAWKKRLARRPIPLVLIVKVGDEAIVVGPSGDPPPAVRLDPRLIIDDLARARELDPLDVRTRLPAVWQRVRGAGGMAGLRNVGLFSTHYLRSRTPRLPEWAALEEQGGAARGMRGLDSRLKALGFESEERGAGVFVLRAAGRPAAAVLSYPPNQDFDRAAAGGELPVAGLLREMETAGTRWGILVSGDLWRLYSAEHPARATTFAEVDLTKLGDPGYFAALFSATALAPEGLAEAIERGSRDFAVGLGGRLRGRVYERVVPSIVGALSDELERLDMMPESREQLEGVYEATLVLLYRLLFVLYAESREYLPVEVSEGYRSHSLRRRVDAIVATVESEREFDDAATDIWSDLQETFAAIARGQREWGVPAYNGGLFHDDPQTAAGQILQRVRPTNAGIGRALYELAVDSDDDDTGRIDYSDLDIRHLGDMYEGLLSFEADRAREDLSYDARSDAYVPAQADDSVSVPSGAVYLRGRSGGRKASGSYYTPQIVVRHVIEEALVPVHEEHLEQVRRLAERDEEKAARLLWDFRVCDPAMGSGHFLVDALDVLTDRIAAFLAERPLAPVRAVLNQLRETVQAQARDLPAGVLDQIRDVDLLKRVVLKRCIYGVDLNPMAVELAKLALWLDAFVPGLPLSYLDHNLRRGNSLVGVVGDEVLAALRPAEATLEADWIAERLSEAVDRARAAVERVELRLEDVDAAREAELERRAATSLLTQIYDRWTAEPFGLPGARGRIAQMDTLEAEADARDSEEIAQEQAFFHWPLELPEVFHRDRPGFDVVLANPPWDKLKVEKHDFFQMLIPGLKFVSSAQERDALIAALPQEANARYEAELSRVSGLKPYFAAAGGNYRLHGGGDPDLFKAFAERFMHLVRSRGGLGCVLPRHLLGGAGSGPLRREFFTGWTVESADVLWNRRVWAFPS
ncbi:MAG: Eco57I restriction-modification methylase domain-containing protein, partial [Jatrophihabitans sp.]